MPPILCLESVRVVMLQSFPRQPVDQLVTVLPTKSILASTTMTPWWCYPLVCGFFLITCSKRIGGAASIPERCEHQRIPVLRYMSVVQTLMLIFIPVYWSYFFGREINATTGVYSVLRGRGWWLFITATSNNLIASRRSLQKVLNNYE